MDITLTGKAKARRVLALNGLSSRRVKRDVVEGFRFLPPLGSEQIGALFNSVHFDRNIFIV
jgi:hypothetical protein